MTEIRLYNTATREKEAFRPLDWQDDAIAPEDKRVRMYVCGPTVYDRAHIGNARPVVVFDVLYRLLQHIYGADHVTYVRNFTDIDDRINKRGAETRKNGESTIEAIRRITDQTIGWYHEDMDALGALRPDAEPRATEHVDGMIRMIDTLIEKGHAYEAEGHVLFHVPSYDAYGSLSRRPLDEMEAGARVDVAPYKKSPMDFVLWKPSDETLPGWESPWGRGRPGWHIECSVMAKALLGERFDIHGGGIDLQFPHHENELAQSCCANGTEKMASVWMHNGFLQVEGEKMAKSLGNFFTVHDLRDRLPGEVIRLVLLSAHYRQPLDWTEQTVQDAFRRLLRWHRAVGDPEAGEVPSPVREALADDLNTPKALAEIDALIDAGDESGARAAMALLNLRAPDLSAFFGAAASARVETLIEERAEARKRKDFARSDEIRNGLNDAGVILKDGPQGTEWEFGAEFDAGKLEAVR